MVIHVSSFQLISGTVSRMKKAIENKISARIARFTNRAALLDLDVLATAFLGWSPSSAPQLLWTQLCTKPCTLHPAVHTALRPAENPEQNANF